MFELIFCIVKSHEKHSILRVMYVYCNIVFFRKFHTRHVLHKISFTSCNVLDWNFMITTITATTMAISYLQRMLNHSLFVLLDNLLHWCLFMIIKYIFAYQSTYSISHEICTRFCCALLCCGYAIVHNEFTWSIYPYSSGLLCWHWGNH